MGRKSEMPLLIDRIEASPLARERAKVMLQTLARQCSVQSGCTTLGMGRTRFQDLRRRMIGAAVGALERGDALAHVAPLQTYHAQHQATAEWARRLTASEGDG